ncbi:MAG: Uma2 family endonuclease [Gemmataceae bacterium]|nr:Uma2 family endonuclease [Gemmataceae bacterium]
MSTGILAPIPSTASALISAAQFAKLHSEDRVELVMGYIQELPMPMPKHGNSCFKAAYYVGDFAIKKDSGRVLTNDTFIQVHTNPDSVRGADVCYYSYERLPRGELPDGLLDILPDMVIEVRSKSDRWNAVFAKVIEYLNAGVRVVVVLDEPSATASVYRSDEIQQIFHNGDELVIPDVLPGFAVPVRRFFE